MAKGRLRRLGGGFHVLLAEVMAAGHPPFRRDEVEHLVDVEHRLHELREHVAQLRIFVGNPGHLEQFADEVTVDDDPLLLAEFL